MRSSLSASWHIFFPIAGAEKPRPALVPQKRHPENTQNVDGNFNLQSDYTYFVEHHGQQTYKPLFLISAFFFLEPLQTCDKKLSTQGKQVTSDKM